MTTQALALSLTDSPSDNLARIAQARAILDILETQATAQLGHAKGPRWNIGNSVTFQRLSRPTVATIVDSRWSDQTDQYEYRLSYIDPKKRALTSWHKQDELWPIIRKASPTKRSSAKSARSHSVIKPPEWTAEQLAQLGIVLPPDHPIAAKTQNG